MHKIFLYCFILFVVSSFFIHPAHAIKEVLVDGHVLKIVENDESPAFIEIDSNSIINLDCDYASFLELFEFSNNDIFLTISMNYIRYIRSGLLHYNGKDFHFIGLSYLDDSSENFISAICDENNIKVNSKEQKLICSFGPGQNHNGGYFSFENGKLDTIFNDEFIGDNTAISVIYKTYKEIYNSYDMKSWEITPLGIAAELNYIKSQGYDLETFKRLSLMAKSSDKILPFKEFAKIMESTK